MSKPSFEDTLNEILSSKAFERLQPFKNARKWKNLTSSQRHLLATVFVAEGESQLPEAEKAADESFNLALRVAPDDPVVIYRQAMAYASQGKSMRCMSAACKLFERATDLSPTLPLAWSGWGCVLIRMGNRQNDPRYLHEAEKKFQEAQKHTHGLPHDKLSEIYWQWALCWFFLGQMDGEVHEFHLSLDKFRQAADLGLNHFVFWNNYGDAIAEMATRIGKKERFTEAAELYKKAIQSNPEDGRSWLNLACSLERVFEVSHQESVFHESNEAFERAADLASDNVDLWLNWGLLYLEVAKEIGEASLFNVCFEKFARADECDPDNPIVLWRWAEAYLLCGTYAENLEPLREAEERILRSLDFLPENARAWGIYGNCLSELGRYFSSADYYLNAIEKFRFALNLAPQDSGLWHNLALTSFALGEMDNDPQMLEQAVQCFAKIMELDENPGLQFWNDLGVAQLRLAEITQDQNIVNLAVTNFEKAIYNDSESSVPAALEWMHNYGCALDLRGEITDEAQDHEKAIQILSDVVAQDPSYLDAQYAFALALVHLGVATDDTEYLQKAFDLYEGLVKEDEEDDMVWNDWGLAYLHMADLTKDSLNPTSSKEYYQLAEEKLQKSAALGSTTAFYNLACLHSQLNNFHAAMHFIERADRSHALPSLDCLNNDEWLEPLRQTPDFHSFISLRSPQE